MNARRIALGLAAGAALAFGLLTIAAASDQTDDVIIYVSSSSSGTVDGIEFKDEDILAYNTETDAWAMHFDGSDLDLSGADINAFHILDDLNAATLDDILFSPKNARSFGAFVADDSDIVRFTPTSLGANTAGTFSLFFDGSDVGLSKNSEEIDAISRLSDGSLIVSTNGSYQVPGSSGSRQDLIRFTPTALGATTAGSWAIYFDGSDVGLSTSNEDVWSSWIDPSNGDIYLTTKDAFSVPGVSGDKDDIFVFSPTSLGSNTAGSYQAFWDGTTHRLVDQRLDGFSIEFLNAPPELDPIGDLSVDELTTLAFTATASDPDLPPDTLTWSLDSASLSEGMTINPANGAFSWTPTEVQGPDVFTVTITVTDDGTPSLSDEETFDITVNEVNEAPVLGAIGDKSVDEGSLLSFTASALDADLPANGLTFSLDAGAPAGASITSTGEFSWTPTEAQGPGSFSVTVRVTDDGSPVMDDSETISITVNEVNEAPVLGAIGDKSVAEGSLLSFTAAALDADLPANGLTFSLDAGAPAGASITSTGEFSWTPTEAQGPGSFSVTVRVTDDGSPVMDDSETISITVNEVNEAPVLGAIGDKSVAEGSLLSFTAAALDADLPANGLTFSLDAGAPAGASITSTGEFSWTPTEAQGPGSFSVTVRVTDDGSPVMEDSETISITVNEVNEAPVLGAIGDKSVAEGSLLSFTAAALDADVPANGLTFSLDAGAPAGASITSTGEFSWTPTEAQGPGSFSVTVRVTDDGSPVMEDSETISITVNEVNVAPTITSSASQTIDENLTAVGTLTATDPDIPVQTLTWSKTGGGADQALLSISTGGDLSFISPPDFETPTDSDADNFYEVEVQVSDGVVATTQLVTVEVIDVVVENLAPVLAPDAFTASFTEDGGPVVIAGAIGVSDGDDTVLVSATVTITNLQDAGDEVLAANTGGTGITAVYAAPTLTLSGTDTVANYQLVLQSVTYENTSDDPTASPDRTIEIDASDGTDPSNTAVSVVSVTAVNDPPVVVAPGPFDVIGNVSISVTDGPDDLLAGASDPAESGTPLFVGGTVPTSSANGGQVVINGTDGTFTYNPAPGFSGSDSFDYQVCDNGSPGSACSAPVTVTLNVGQVIWFVDASAGLAGDGRLGSPFQGFGGGGNSFGALAADGAGDAIFLADGAYEGGVTLLNDQVLVGDGSSSDLETILSITTPPYSATLPAFSGFDPVVTTTTPSTNGINLAAGNTVRGLDIGNTTGTGINGTNVGTLAISEVGISGTGGGVDLTSATGSTIAVTLDDLSASSSTDEGIRLSNVNGSFTVTSSSGSIATSGVAAVDIDGGVTSLSVDATFASVGATGGGNGILLRDVSAGSFTANGGSISGVGGRGVDLDNVDATVNIGSSISNVAGRTVEATGSSGAATFSGAIDDNALGINLATNPGGSFTFSGGLVLDTGSNTALSATGGGIVQVTGSNNTVGATAPITGTAVNIVGTDIGVSGVTFRSLDVGGGSKGIILSATGATGGGFTVTGTGTTDGSGGTITAVSQRGADIQNTQNVTLKNMNFTMTAAMANGADPTNAASGCGGLLTGSNLSCNGAIHLVAVTNVVLDNLDVTDSRQQGINGNDVNGFTLTNSNVLRNGDQTREDGLRVHDLRGTVSITGTVFDDNESDQVHIVNDSVALPSFTMSGSTLQDSQAPNGGNGIKFEFVGTATATVVVSNNTFSDLFSGAILFDGTDTANASIEITGNSMDDSHAGGRNNGFGQITSNLSADISFDIHDNPEIEAERAGITINQLAQSTSSGTLIGRIEDNPNIRLFGVGATFVTDNSAIDVKQNGAGTLTVLIDNNVVVNDGHQSGIFGIARDDATSNGTLNMTITNNTVSSTNASNGFHGINVEAGTSNPANTNHVCADITSNTASSAGADAIEVDQNDNATFDIEGLTGSGASAANVESYVAGANPATTASGIDAQLEVNGFGSASACPTPP